MDALEATLVFVRPQTNRTAFAAEPERRRCAVGSRVGHPYEAGGWEVGGVSACDEAVNTKR